MKFLFLIFVILIVGCDSSQKSFVETNDDSASNSDNEIDDSNDCGSIISPDLGNDSDLAQKENRSPVIKSDAPDSAIENQEYKYRITCSDPDGDELTLKVGKNDTCGGVVSKDVYLFTPDEKTGSTSCNLEVVCSDSIAEAVQSQIVTISEDYNAPAIMNLPAKSTTHWKNSGEFKLDVEDKDGDSLVFTVEEDCLLNSDVDSDGTVKWTCAGIEKCDMTVKAVDNSEKKMSSEAKLTVNCVNSALTINSKPANEAKENIEYVYTVECFDPDGDQLTLKVGENDTCDAVISGNKYSFTPDETKGLTSCVLDIVCSDSATEIVQSQTISILEDHNAPLISNLPQTRKSHWNKSGEYKLSVTDPDGDDIELSLKEDCLLSASLDDEGRVSWQCKGLEKCEIIVSAQEKASTKLSVTGKLTVQCANSKPEIISTFENEVYENGTYDYEIVCEDEDGDSVAVTIGEMDSCGGTLKNNVYSFKTDETMGGESCDLVVGCSDGMGNDVQSLEIQIQEDNNPPVIFGLPATVSSHWNGSGDLRIMGMDEDNHNISWSVSESCRLETSIDSDGYLAWECRGKESCEIEFSAADDSAEKLTSSEIFTVNCTNSTPLFITKPFGRIAADATYTYVPACEDSDGDVLAITVGENDTCGGDFNGKTYQFAKESFLPGEKCNIDIRCSDGQDFVDQNEEISIRPKAVMLNDFNKTPRGRIVDSINSDEVIYYLYRNSDYSSIYEGQYELWKSDDISNELILVKTFDDHLSENEVSFLSINDTGVYLNFHKRKTNEEKQWLELHTTQIWFSNGSASGTGVVGILKKTYESTTLFKKPESIGFIDDNFYFIAVDDENGKKIWKSDGIKMNMDFIEYAEEISNISLYNIKIINGKLYLFNGRDVLEHDPETPGFSLNINHPYFPEFITKVGDVLYFYSDGKILKFNGTVLEELHSFEEGIEITSMHSFKEQLIVFSRNSSRKELYLWFESEDHLKIELIKKFSYEGQHVDYGYLYFSNSVSDYLIFREHVSYYDSEKERLDLYWKTDGTAHGTEILSSIFYNYGFSYGNSIYSRDGKKYDLEKNSVSSTTKSFENKEYSPKEYFVFRGHLYARSDYIVWKADDEKFIPTRLTFDNCTRKSEFIGLTVVDDELYFSSEQGAAYNNYAYKTDGTSFGTVSYADLNDDRDYVIERFVKYGDSVFYINSRLLMKINEDSRKVDDIFDSQEYSLSNLQLHNDKLYFSASEKLFVSNGTADSSSLYLEMVDEEKRYPIEAMESCGKMLYLATVSSKDKRIRLWSVDGEGNRTLLNERKNESGDWSFDREYSFKCMGQDRVVFSGGEKRGYGNDGNLVTSDGTLSGTNTIFERGVNIESIISYNDHFYFETEGCLWRSDGSTEETYRITKPDGEWRRYHYSQKDDFFIESESIIAWMDGISGEAFYKYTPEKSGVLGVVNGSFFFYDNDGEYSNIWKIDSEENMELFLTLEGDVKSLKVFYNDFFVFENYDFFNSKRELWISDGSIKNTTKISDSFRSIDFGDGGRYSKSELINNRIVFSADDGKHGFELWSYEIY